MILPDSDTRSIQHKFLYHSTWSSRDIIPLHLDLASLVSHGASNPPRRYHTNTDLKQMQHKMLVMRKLMKIRKINKLVLVSEFKRKWVCCTSLDNCCRISIISEKSGLNVGSCCQHLSRSSTNFGWVPLGMVGRRP